jgi:hypothetical protein
MTKDKEYNGEYTMTTWTLPMTKLTVQAVLATALLATQASARHIETLDHGAVWRLEAVGLTANTAQASVTLRPVLRTTEGWKQPSADDCELRTSRYHCRIVGYGDLVVDMQPSVHVTFTATKATSVIGIGLGGSMHLPDTKGWLSNGFQSWSQTGVIALRKPVSEAALNKALALIGEDEVYRRGREFSWWYSFASGGHDSFLAGATTAQHLKSWVQLTKGNQTDDINVKIISGATEKLDVQPGESIKSEAWTLYLGPELAKGMEVYAAAIPSRHYHKPQPVPVGWNSWYELWNTVKAEDVLGNAHMFSQLFQSRLPSPNLPAYIVLDDGWQQAWGDWYPNNKFPHGISSVAKELNDQGFTMGIWLAPLLVAKSSQLARNHPDWLVQGARYSHPTTGEYGVLDVTNPKAAEHLQATISRIVGWGIKLLKIDFLFAGTIEGKRYKQVTGSEAYERALALIRAAAGEQTQLMAVGAPPIPSLKYVDGWRVGGDIAFTPSIFGWPQPNFAFIANQARSVAGRYPYCLATLCDADPVLLRSPLPANEVNVGSWVVAATGSALFLSDDLRQLTAERAFWALDHERVRVATSGEPAVPASFVPPQVPDELVSMKDSLYTAEHHVPNLWIMPNGDKVGLNFSHSAAEIAGKKVPPKSSVVIK